MRIMTAILFFCLMATPAWASITFVNGKWSTTFDCPVWDHPTTGWNNPCPDESGMQSRGGTTDGKRTQITPQANYSKGSGGSGARFWTGSGSDNKYSAPIRITFSQRQPELWVRYYFRYEQGFRWVYGAKGGTKEIYWDVNMSGAGASAYTGLLDTTVRTVNQSGDRLNGSLVFPSSNGRFGWNHIYPGGTSDGSWQCMEVYMKIDSGSGKFDGVGRIWLNGQLIAEQHNVNWSGGNQSAGRGWSHFEFLSNQKDPGLNRPYYTDVDDMVIYNRRPPNVDAHGNPFIGPIGGGGTSPDPVALPSPTNLKVIQPG